MPIDNHEIESVDPAPRKREQVNYLLIIGGGLVFLIPQVLVSIARIRALFADLSPQEAVSTGRDVALTFLGIVVTGFALVIALVVVRRRGLRAVQATLGVDPGDVVLLTPTVGARDLLAYWFDSGREGPFRVHGALSIHAGYTVDADSRDLRLFDVTRTRDDGRALKFAIERSEILDIGAREISSTLVSGPGVRVEARGGQTLDFVAGRGMPTQGATLDDAERLVARIRDALGLEPLDEEKSR